MTKLFAPLFIIDGEESVNLKYNIKLQYSIMRQTRSILTAAIIALAPLLAFSQNFVGNQDEIAKILQATQSFSEYVMASDHEMIGSTYTTDAKIFPSDKDIIHGREEITKYWIQPEGFRTSYHKISPEEIKVIGDEAYDYGYYEGTSINADGKETSWKGKYVVIWKKVGDDWKIYLDIWNRMPPGN